MKLKFRLTIILIFVSVLISIFYASLNIKNYDKNIVNKNGDSFHLMIKNDTHRYFSHGYEIKEQLKKNIDYFQTGRINFTKYLYPRIIALYYLVFDYDLYENIEKKIVKKNIHQNFLYIQILFYYLSVFFLYTQLNKKIENKFLFFSIFFLCLEPTIFQYHGSFWSESIFFSLQILIMGFILSNNFSNYRLLILGILLAFLALQRTNGFYYFIPILLYLYLIKEFNFFKKIPIIVLGFFLVMSFVGYHSFKKSGKFFIVPLETKAVLSAYAVPLILSKEDLEIEKTKALELIAEKNIEIDINELKNSSYSRYSFIFCENFNNQKTNLKFLEMCEYFDKRSKILILSNPINSVKFLIKSSLSFSLLNPFHVYSDYKFFSGEEYYNSELHKKLKLYRMIYTIIIYLICIFGLIKIIKNKENKLLLFILLSSFYYFFILSWHGNNRYFVPVLIYLSLLFGYGFSSILSFFDKDKKKIN